MKILTNIGGVEIWIQNISITEMHEDGSFDVIGDNWSAFHTSLTGITDDDGSPINPLEVFVRSKRDNLLKECDYTQTLDYPATDTERTAWAVYRQSLRDIPEQEGFPNDVAWPTTPVRDKGGTILQALETII